jgi:hypothetical protein
MIYVDETRIDTTKTEHVIWDSRNYSVKKDVGKKGLNIWEAKVVSKK